jgi:hypothetical protein
MFWFLVPVVIVVAIVVVSVWIIAANVRRRGGDGVRTPGQTIYERDEPRKPQNAPPA